MFITKKYLSRRAVLRGVGTSIALPFLDAMVPAATAIAQTAAAPKPRMGFFYMPHGAIMRDWTPEKVGTDFDFKPILKPFEPFRDMVNVVSGLDNRPAQSSAVHAITPGTWLTCAAPRRSHAPYVGISADQVAVQHIGQETAIPSIEVSTEEKGGASACDGTYGCTVGTTIAWSNPATPMPMEFSAKKFFAKLFGEGRNEQERKLIAGDYQSLLDMVTDETNSLKKRLGAADRVMLDNYLTSVREIERRVNNLENRDLSMYDLPELPVGIPDFEERTKLMFDMIALAYQANSTRIITFMLAAEVSQQAYNHIGVPDAFHPLSHHNNSADAINRLTKIQTWHSQTVADFMATLAEIPDGENSILENSIFLYGSNMSNSNVHNNFPLPSVVLGGGAGKLKGNQHLVYEDHTPIANLLLTLLQSAGVPVESHGDSDGTMPELLA
jgi:hypothetical protein